MEYFTDTEYRILSSALSREREICKQVDQELEAADRTKLLDVMCKIEKKDYGFAIFRAYIFRRGKAATGYKMTVCR